MFNVSVVMGLAPGIVQRVDSFKDPAEYFAALPLPTLGDTGRKNDDAPLVVMGRCDVGAPASNDTWRGSRLVMLDIDWSASSNEPPPPSFTTAVAEAGRLGYGFIAGPSRRNGVNGDIRYRFLFMLEDEAVTVRVYAETAKYLATAIGVAPDPRSFVPSQRWYGFTPTVVYPGPGAPLQFASLNHAPSPDEVVRPARSAVVGERRHTLYQRARVIGSMAHAGMVDAESMMAQLEAIAAEQGLMDDEYARHLRRGFEAGMSSPRSVCIPRPPRPAGRAGADAWAREVARWDATLRASLDCAFVVLEHAPNDERVLYRRAGGRRVIPLVAPSAAASAVRAVAASSGLDVTAEHAEEIVRDLLTSPHGEFHPGTPTLFDTGEGFYRYEIPVATPGPTPTWDAFLERLSDPEAFLSHVHALVEPKWKGRQVLWLQGMGNDGKTLAINAIARGVFGLEGLAVLDDVALANRSPFVFSTVWDRPLVVIPDTKNGHLVMSGMVHRLVGRDLIPVENKYRTPFKAQFQGSVWVTSNPMPSIENSPSNTTRLTVLRVSPPKEFIHDLERKYIAEIPALLAKARDAYALRCRDHFRIELNEAATSDLAGTTVDMSDKFAVWAERIRLTVTGAEEDSVKSTELYRALETRGIRSHSMERWQFYTWLMARGARMENRADYRRVVGIRLPGVASSSDPAPSPPPPAAAEDVSQ